MVTATTRAKSLNLKPFFILCLLVILAVIGVELSHALTKHEDEGLLVRQCIENKGADLMAQISQKRVLQFCEVRPFTIGLRVLDRINDKWEEITGYFQGEFNSIHDAFFYVQENGYKIILRLPE